ncbi:MAG: trypsin-like peptidase domain-containing protein [Acidobacteria bacterium]|nr:trypsin-like peptidase domain-containing protein [Acidobacteriota bacterium]
MNVLDAIRQTTRRSGGGQTRRRDTDEFERSTRDWRSVEQPERVLSRMERLGMHREVLTLTSSMERGEPFPGFNPLEAVIGRSQLISSLFLPLGAERTRAVGRIVAHNGGGYATGFLISPRLLMTNNHVIERDGIAAGCRVEFDYVRHPDGRIGATQVFNLLPGEFFLTSETRDGVNLDYTIVAVEAVNRYGEFLAARGSIPLSATPGVLLVKESANIIQHPGGDEQQVALRDNKVVESLEHFIRYEADTKTGSSGSPVFNDQWQLAALHHSGVPETVRPGVYRLRDGGEWDARPPLPYHKQEQMSARVKWVSNEGVLVSSIVADARARLAGDATRRALFEEAVRDDASPLGERGGGVCQEVFRQPVAAPELLPQAAQGSVTWTIPLQITVQLGPGLQLSATGGLAAPVQPFPPQAPVLNNGSALAQPPDEFDHAAVFERIRKELEERAEVLEVRDGFLWHDDFMTEERAAVVVLDPGIEVAPGDPYGSLNIPREVDGLPVDITLGGPAAQLRAAGREGTLAAEAPPPAELFQERVPTIGYVKPEGVSLEEVREPMEVICHVSPDEGWPVLEEFLGRTRETLTLGIFDLSAPHVVGKLMELARRNPEFRFNLAIQRGLAGGLRGVKKNDLDEERVVEDLRGVLGDRFRQAYVNVSGNGRTFASAYHVKAAVRDGEELWLSSGNMQSSNQPPPDVRPLTAGGRGLRLLRSYNREWHVVVRNRRLAQMFEAYLLHDLETAAADPAPPPAPARELFVHAGPPAADTSFFEAEVPPRYFARQVIRGSDGAPVNVQPLLTPDNYIEHVIGLVRSARNRLFIQNQSLSLLDPLENNEDEFIELWKAVKSRQEAGADVRMIFRVHIDEDHARAVKDRLVKFGFRPECIRVQPGCHTKGVVVDSEAVLLGSHNWTNHGVKANRDASLIFRHKEIAEYYERIFLFDWDRLAREPRPVGPASIGSSHLSERVEPSRADSPQPADTARLSYRDMLDD